MLKFFLSLFSPIVSPGPRLPTARGRFRASLLLIAALLCLAPLAGCASDDGDDSGGIDPESLDFTAFDQAMDKYLTDNKMQGASVAIVHKDLGVVHQKGYGSFAADRIYLIASSSKVLSVGVLLWLADQKLLDMNAPISTYLSAWGEYKTNISTAQLLSNSAGMVGLMDNPLYAKYLCQYMYNTSLQDCAKTIYTAADEGERVPPDTKFRYGGGQWQLAGGIAEVVSGKSWYQLIDEIYVKPCGTKNFGYGNQYMAAFGSGGGLTSALGYPTFFQGNVANLPATENPNVEGGGYSTVEDYAKFLLMHLRGGLCDENRVLSEASVTLMQQDRILQAYNGNTPVATMAGYGMGWWIDRNAPGVLTDFGLYGADAWLDLPRNYGAIILVESSFGSGAALYLATKPSLDAVFDKAAAEAE